MSITAFKVEPGVGWHLAGKVPDACTSAGSAVGAYAALARLKLMADCFVEFNCKPVASVKKGFKSAVGLARLGGKVTPHTCRDLAVAAWRAGLGGGRVSRHVG